MKFRTEFPNSGSSISISYSNKILLLGSCFSDNIGSLLSIGKFDCLSNPAGIIYNPISLANIIESSLGQKPAELRVAERDGHFFSYDHHSSVYGTTKEELNQKINVINKSIKRSLLELDRLFITWGTAWVYEIEERVVANCHKQAASTFHKRLLDLSEVIERYKSLFQTLKAVNPKLELILTLSPVRHLKDGFVENQVSKSILRLAINQLQEVGYHYFPSYEIVLDDLRDYRFFEKDLVHPNKLAIEYVWSIFKATYFEESTLNTLKNVESIQNRLNHKPLRASSEAHQNFIKKLQADMIMLQDNTRVDLSKELTALNSKLPE